jgi:hypothetical protein
MAPIFPVCFEASDLGTWRIERIEPVVGATLPPAARLAAHTGPVAPPAGEASAWRLRGTAGHHRYVERLEKAALIRAAPPLARPDATRAALIPIKKTDAWWELAQDERRAIFEAGSHHISASMKYLPAVARRLYHSRELGEPFDFLTWFEYAPQHLQEFEDLVGTLRRTEEWHFIEREVDIRLERIARPGRPTQG